jgi:hypothetical protein
MPHLWREDRSAGTGEPEWIVQRLDGEVAVRLGPAAGVRSAGPLPSIDGARDRVGSLPRSQSNTERDSGVAAERDDDAAALLLRSRTDEGETWLVISATATGVALNGEPLHAGIRVLADRDELRITGLGRVFFSTEQLARVTPFPGADKSTFCPRCKQEIAPGSPAVRCPSSTCQRWYHQSDEYPCWTYTEKCLCGHPTALDAGFQWTPNEL